MLIGVGKLALLQNRGMDLDWKDFANVLMRVGKKAAGKRINFALGM